MLTLTRHHCVWADVRPAIVFCVPRSSVLSLVLRDSFCVLIFPLSTVSSLFVRREQEWAENTTLLVEFTTNCVEISERAERGPRLCCDDGLLSAD